MTGRFQTDDALDTSVAVIGLAGRFPGARDVRTFWQNIVEGVDSVSRFDVEELAHAGVQPAVYTDPRYVPARGALGDADNADYIGMFDAEFFGVAPRDASLLDPQHRLFMEVCWEALEDAGHAPGEGEITVGVFGGSGPNDYARLIGDRGDSGQLMAGLLGNSQDYLCSHVSYTLDLRGPSVTVQTACSTALVALHLAVQSLLCGECDMALAGASSVIVPDRAGYLYEEGGMLSKTGRCRAFDVAADGSVFGSGVGVVLLRRADEAFAEGDHIHALIRGTAVNNDGAARVGFAAPGVDGRTRVIREALSVAGLRPGDVGYVEANGTGSPISDEMELRAVRAAFADAPVGSCGIGSVKTNVGHLGAAAGIASLIKAVMAVEDGRMPPSLHYEAGPPDLAGDDSPLELISTLRRWNGSPRRAGVSAFGIGGTNAHVVIEEAPRQTATSHEEAPSYGPFVVSARSAAALEAASRRLADHLERMPEIELGDVAHTLRLGRRHFPFRRAETGRTVPEVIEAFRRVRPPPVDRGPDVRVAFLLSSEPIAALPTAMYDESAEFRAAVDGCAHLLRPRLGLDVGALFADGAGRPDVLANPRYAPAIRFAGHVALAEAWRAWGVQPALVVAAGGETDIAAAYLGGHLGLEEAVARICGREIDALPHRARDGGPELVLGADEPALAGIAGRSDDTVWVVVELGLACRSPVVGIERALAEREGSGRSLNRAVLASDLGSIWEAGAPVDWRVFDVDVPRRRVPLPTYPFERRHHWVETTAAPASMPQRDDACETSTVPARTLVGCADLERDVALVWGAVLGVEPEAMNGETFTELGGTSLRLAEVRTRLEDVVGIDVPLDAVAQNGTVGELAAMLAVRLLTQLDASGQEAAVDAMADLDAERLLTCIRQTRANHR